MGEGEKGKTRARHKETALMADHRLFGQMVLITTSIHLNMQEVLKHPPPLDPLPWSLANSDSTMKKTNKAALASELEKKVALSESILQLSISIINGTSLLQRVHGENFTFF